MSNIAKSRAGRKGTPATAILDRRFSAHEADRRDQQFARSMLARQRRQLVLMLDEALTSPTLARHLKHHRELPDMRLKWKPRLKRIEALHAAYGPLVLLTVLHPGLLHLDVYSEALAKKCRSHAVLALKGVTLTRLGYEALQQRGGKFDGDHTHFVLPLSCLRPKFREQVSAAPHGPKGGCMLHSGAHAVIMGDSAEDREKVAKYLSRPRDQRLDLKTPRPDRLAGYEDLLQHRAAHGSNLPTHTYFQKIRVL